MEVIHPCCPVENVPGCRFGLYKKSTAARALGAEAKENGRKAKRRLRDLHSRFIAARRFARGSRLDPCSHGVRGSVLESVWHILREQF